MNGSQKIKLDSNNKEFDRYIKIKLDNEIESLEFLTIKINSNDIYQSFNADYGVLVGRVIANNGIGVPNAKISIFIPLDDEDEFNENIKYIYPYKNPRDKNNEGKRYNLLPRVSKIDSTTGVIRPQQPFGSFPIKEEIVVNINHLNVYKKYYKYTAQTNQYGDYMIFGTPIGTQTIHMSLDITDIGEYSMTPASMVTNLGYSENLFIDNNTRIKPSDDLNDLPHIETQDITVDIIPFWGDNENYDIGITRQDFRVRTTLNNTFTIFGNAFTDGGGTMWGAPTDNNTITPHELYNIGDNDDFDLSIISKRGVMINETIYYYPSNISDYDIENDNVNEKDMRVLSKSEYSRYIEPDGRFVYIINCNRRKKVLNDQNILIDVNFDYNGGIFTEFRGFVVFETDDSVTRMNIERYLGNDRGLVEPFRYKLKVPQEAYLGKTFTRDDVNINTINWKKSHQVFTGGKIYSVSRYHGLVCNTENQTTVKLNSEGLFNRDVANDLNQDPVFNVGIIKSPLSGVTNTYIVPVGFTGTTLSDPMIIVGSNNVPFPEISGYTYVFNPEETYPLLIEIDVITKGDKSKSLVPNSNDDLYFGAEWLNLSIYFPQIGELKTHVSRNDDVRSATHFNSDPKNIFYYENNIQEIAAGEVNTRYFGRSDINKIKFVEVSKSDINEFINQPNNGFTISGGLTGTYISNNPNKYYFYKGFGVDCVKYLKRIGIV